MSDELITIATYGTLPEAEAARLCLEADGITTFLADAETVAMDWLLANAIGNIKLQVFPPQKENAIALLEQMRLHRKEREQNPEYDAISSCLACGAELPEKVDRCPACGWTWLRTDGVYHTVETIDRITPEIDTGETSLRPRVVAINPSNAGDERHEQVTSDEEPSSRNFQVRREILAVLFLGIIPSIFYAIYSRFDPRIPSTFAGDMFLLIANSLQIAVPLIYIMSRSGQPWRYFGIVRFRAILDSAIGIGLLVFVVVPYLYLAMLIVENLQPPYYEASEQFQFLSPGSVSDYALLVVAMCANAFSEELLVRGYLIPRLKHCSASPTLAVLISSFLWAAYHVYQGMDYSVVIFVEGILLGIAFLFLRRLWPLVIAHTLWDILSYCAS